MTFVCCRYVVIGGMYTFLDRSVCSGIDCDMIFICSPVSDIGCGELICSTCCEFTKGNWLSCFGV